MKAVAVASGALLAAALLLVRPPAGWVARRRLGLDDDARRLPSRRWLIGLAATGVVVGAPLVVDAPATVAVVLVLGGVGCFAVSRVVAGRRRSAIERRRAEVGAVLDLLAAELRSGRLPAQAVAAAATDLPGLGSVAAVARAGGDVPAALRGAARAPGAEALAALAQAWSVAERAGAPLSDVLDRVAEGVRLDLAVAREASAEAAPARATGRLMAGLPLLGLALGSSLGADPLRVLTTTLPGVVCLAVGAGAACVGVVWIDRVADRLTVTADP